MKRIVQNLLAVFLLAVLLVPVTALGEDGTVTECSNCNSTNIYVTRKNCTMESTAVYTNAATAKMRPTVVMCPAM